VKHLRAGDAAVKRGYRYKKQQENYAGGNGKSHNQMYEKRLNDAAGQNTLSYHA